MVKIIRRFFAFCGEENRHKFRSSIWLGVLQALFEAMKIPAIACMVRTLLRGSVTTRDILLSLGIMLLSILGSGLIKAKSTMLQTEAGYDTCAKKRVEIAEHMRYLPMGYFNENSLGQITSVTTNVMENLENVATRVVMLVCEGLLTTSLIIVMLFFFDWRIALVLLAGFALFLLANRFLQKAAGGLAGRKLSADEKLVEKVLEYLQGMAEVKAYHLTGLKSRELNDAIAANAKINTEMEMTLIPRMTAQNFIAKLTGVCMVAFSCAFYCADTMDALTAVVMVISAFIVYASLETAGNYSALLRVVDVSVERAQAILDTQQMDITGEDIKPAARDIRADAVEFSYEKRKVIRRRFSSDSRKDHNGHRGPLRRRQDDAGESSGPLLGRRQRRSDAGRKKRQRLRHGFPDGELLLCVPERLSLPRHHRQQHPLRPAGGEHGHCDRGGEEGLLP